MNEEEKDSVKILNNTELDVNTIYSVDLYTYNYAVKTVLNLIEKQQAEIEKKDKIIKLAYREANNVLYFDDNSDYCCALWEILRIINPELEEYPTLNYIDEEDK